jgi:beta propeller repeat protein
MVSPSLLVRRSESARVRGGPHSVGVLAIALILAVGLAWTAAANPAPRSQEIIVKYRSQGAHALDACAEAISAGGRSFQAHLRDRSDSLDRLARRHGIGPQIAVFGRSGATDLDSRRSAMRGRWAASVRKFPRGRDSDALESPRLPDLAHVYRLRVPRGISAQQLVDDLEADPHVEYAQLNHAINLDQSFTPNDPFFHSSGSWGQDHPDLWGPDRIHAPEVWARSQGEGMIVAVVDTGLDADHPDIVGNVWLNAGEDLDGDGIAEASDLNGVDDDGNGFIDDLTGFDFANSIDADGDGFYDGPEDVIDSDPFDDNGHGSHVAGTIAAVGDNGIGIIGIAPRSKLMALKGFPAEGSGSDVDLWRAVLYAAEMGATVVNNSWSCGSPCPENPLAEDVLALVNALGMVVVTSAGNASDDVLFLNPENSDRVVTVGALGVDERIASFSNRGWLMDIVAPGGGPNLPVSIRAARRNILSLLSSGAPSFREVFAVGGDYLRFSGTSMASPHVAGAVALLRSLRPDLTPRDVRRLIRISAEDVGSAGHDATYGAGVLDVARLVDTGLPDLELRIDSPRPGVLHDPDSGPLRVVGRAAGSALASLEIEVGRGLNARSFEPLSSFGDSAIETDTDVAEEERVLAQWDASGATDGPYVIRVRAHLTDGRVAEEHTVVGIERNEPIRISSGDRPVARPSLSGRQIVGHVDEPEKEENGLVEHDLVISRFPDRARALPEVARAASSIVFEREGDQRNPVSQGRDIAWENRVDSSLSFERCHLDRGGRRCEPIAIETEPGRYFQVRIGGDWMLWMRFDMGVSRLEGCRIGSPVQPCVPRSLIPPEFGEGWLLASFDGETAYLRRGFGEQARCRISETDGLCRPEVVSFEDTPAPPVEVVHDGNLVAFTTLDTESRLPPGCPEFDPELDCVPKPTPVSQVYACRFEAEETSCDAMSLTPSVPLAGLEGVDVSGDRVTWAIANQDDKTAVHFCQFVGETKECIEQRLSGTPWRQGRPSIDADRIVWEDSRSGMTGIFGFELPSVESALRLDVVAGRPFRIPLRVDAGTADGLRFELSGLDGVAPVEARAAVVSAGRSSPRAFLIGEMPRSASGFVRWRLRAIGDGGLFTDRVIELVIESKNRR